MDLAFNIALIAIGCAALYFGAEWLVGGSSRLALRLGIAPLVVGLTVVAFGTSAPELFVCISLIMGDSGGADAAVGNVVGSNICNIALILGAGAVMRPLLVKSQIIVREMPILLIATGVFLWMIYDNQLEFWEGFALFAAVIVYTMTALYFARREKDPEVEREFREGLEVEPDPAKKKPVTVLFGLILSGLVTLVIGAIALKQGAMYVAEAMGVSKAVIGLTLYAVGTSLPELATSVVASLKNEGDIVTGNAIGSCIFNIFCVMGLTTLYSYGHSGAGLVFSGIEPLDLWMMMGTAAVVLPLMLTRNRLGRMEGLLLLAVYGGYCYLLSQRGAI